MSYSIDRLEQAGGLSPMQPVERVGHVTRKRSAEREARRVARKHPGSWVQVSYAHGAVLITYRYDGYRVRRV